MPATPEIAVIVSTYQRPQHLRRCLLSLSQQRKVDGKFEVVVVDDGSLDETGDMVARIARETAFPLRFITHEHDGFQLARCRNAGVRASTAPYLLFTDGDCIFPADHLKQQLAARRPGIARAGHCIRLDEATSERIDESAIRSGAFTQWASGKERRAMRKLHWKSLLYQAMRHPERPKLIGWNIGVARDDLHRINGFDEQFRGWGCEDDDLERRLRMQGVRTATSIGYTHGFHLWHPPHATTPSTWRLGVNVDYFSRPLVLSRCLAGLERRRFEHLNVRVIANEPHVKLAHRVGAAFPYRSGQREIEVVFWPAPAMTTSDDAKRVVVVAYGQRLPRDVERSADGIIRLGPGDDASDVLRELQRHLGLAPRAATAGGDKLAMAA